MACTRLNPSPVFITLLPPFVPERIRLIMNTMATCVTAQIAPIVAARAQLATTRPLSSRASSTSTTSKTVSFKGCQRQISRVVCNADGPKGF
eukprot:1744538-Pyramimonas_sp.AAC.1